MNAPLPASRPAAPDGAPPDARFQPARFVSGRFLNPSGRQQHGLLGALRWLATRSRGPWPARVEEPPAPVPAARHDDGALHATLVGHATVLLQFDGLNVLTDPVMSHRIGPTSWIGPTRVRPPAIAFADLPRIDLVLLSHDHYDHLDRPSLAALARRDDPLVLTGLRVGRKVPSRRVIELDWWQSHDLRPGVRITYVPAEHFSGRGAFDRNASLWGGFVVEAPSGRIYFAGDTAEGAHFAAVRERFGPMTLSLIPIGAYAPRWFMAPVHIDPAQAMQASLELASQASLAIHYGTFNLADDAYDAPPLALARARAGVDAARPGSDFRVVPFGEDMSIRTAGC